MVFAKYIASVLTTYLGSFIKDVDKESVKVSLLRGAVVLRNLEPLPSIVPANVPIELVRGMIGSLSLQIPWRNLYSRQCVIQINDICVVLSSASAMTSEEAVRHALENKLKMLALFKLTENIPRDDGTSAGSKDKKKSSSGFFDRLRHSILNNIRIELNGLTIRFESPSSSPSSSSATGGHISLVLKIPTLRCEATDENYEPTFIKDGAGTIYRSLTYDNITVHVGASDPPLLENGSPADAHWLSLEGDNFVSACKDTGHNFASILDPSHGSIHVAYKKLETHSITCSIVVQPGTVHLCYETFQAGLTLLKKVLRAKSLYQRLSLVRERRSAPPAQRPSAVNARQWWRFALCEVLRTIRERNGTTKFEWDTYQEWKAKCSRYYYHSLSELNAPWIAMSEANGEVHSDLEVDTALSLDDLLDCRKQAREAIDNFRTSAVISPYVPYLSALMDDIKKMNRQRQREEAQALPSDSASQYLLTANGAPISLQLAVEWPVFAIRLDDDVEIAVHQFSVSASLDESRLSAHIGIREVSIQYLGGGDAAAAAVAGDSVHLIKFCNDNSIKGDAISVTCTSDFSKMEPARADVKVSDVRAYMDDALASALITKVAMYSGLRSFISVMEEGEVGIVPPPPRRQKTRKQHQQRRTEDNQAPKRTIDFFASLQAARFSLGDDISMTILSVAVNKLGSAPPAVFVEEVRSAAAGASVVHARAVRLLPGSAAEEAAHVSLSCGTVSIFTNLDGVELIKDKLTNIKALITDGFRGTAAAGQDDAVKPPSPPKSRDISNPLRISVTATVFAIDTLQFHGVELGVTIKNGWRVAIACREGVSCGADFASPRSRLAITLWADSMLATSPYGDNIDHDGITFLLEGASLHLRIGEAVTTVLERTYDTLALAIFGNEDPHVHLQNRAGTPTPHIRGSVILNDCAVCLMDPMNEPGPSSSSSPPPPASTFLAAPPVPSLVICALGARALVVSLDRYSDKRMEVGVDLGEQLTGFLEGQQADGRRIDLLPPRAGGLTHIHVSLSPPGLKDLAGFPYGRLALDVTLANRAVVAHLPTIMALWNQFNTPRLPLCRLRNVGSRVHYSYRESRGRSLLPRSPTSAAHAAIAFDAFVRSTSGRSPAAAEGGPYSAPTFPGDMRLSLRVTRAELYYPWSDGNPALLHTFVPDLVVQLGNRDGLLRVDMRGRMSIPTVRVSTVQTCTARRPTTATTAASGGGDPAHGTHHHSDRCHCFSCPAAQVKLVYANDSRPPFNMGVSDESLEVSVTGCQGGADGRVHAPLFACLSTREAAAWVAMMGHGRGDLPPQPPQPQQTVQPRRVIAVRVAPCALQLPSAGLAACLWEGLVFTMTPLGKRVVIPHVSLLGSRQFRRRATFISPAILRQLLLMQQGRDGGGDNDTSSHATSATTAAAPPVRVLVDIPSFACADNNDDFDQHDDDDGDVNGPGIPDSHQPAGHHHHYHHNNINEYSEGGAAAAMTSRRCAIVWEDLQWFATPNSSSSSNGNALKYRKEFAIGPVTCGVTEDLLVGWMQTSDARSARTTRLSDAIAACRDQLRRSYDEDRRRFGPPTQVNPSLPPLTPEQQQYPPPPPLLLRLHSVDLSLRWLSRWRGGGGGQVAVACGLRDVTYRGGDTAAARGLSLHIGDAWVSMRIGGGQRHHEHEQEQHSAGSSSNKGIAPAAAWPFEVTLLSGLGVSTDHSGEGDGGGGSTARVRVSPACLSLYPACYVLLSELPRRLQQVKDEKRAETEGSSDNTTSNHNRRSTPETEQQQQPVMTVEAALRASAAAALHALFHPEAGIVYEPVGVGLAAALRRVRVVATTTTTTGSGVKSDRRRAAAIARSISVLFAAERSASAAVTGAATAAAAAAAAAATALKVGDVGVGAVAAPARLVLSIPSLTLRFVEESTDGNSNSHADEEKGDAAAAAAVDTVAHEWARLQLVSRAVAVLLSSSSGSGGGGTASALSSSSSSSSRYNSAFVQGPGGNNSNINFVSIGDNNRSINSPSLRMADLTAALMDRLSLHVAGTVVTAHADNAWSVVAAGLVCRHRHQQLQSLPPALRLSRLQATAGGGGAAWAVVAPPSSSLAAGSILTNSHSYRLASAVSRGTTGGAGDDLLSEGREENSSHSNAGGAGSPLLALEQLSVYLPAAQPLPSSIRAVDRLYRAVTRNLSPEVGGEGGGGEGDDDITGSPISGGTRAGSSSFAFATAAAAPPRQVSIVGCRVAALTGEVTAATVLSLAEYLVERPSRLLFAYYREGSGGTRRTGGGKNIDNKDADDPAAGRAADSRGGPSITRITDSTYELTSDLVLSRGGRVLFFSSATTNHITVHLNGHTIALDVLRAAAVTTAAQAAAEAAAATATATATRVVGAKRGRKTASASRPSPPPPPPVEQQQQRRPREGIALIVEDGLVVTLTGGRVGLPLHLWSRSLMEQAALSGVDRVLLPYMALGEGSYLQCERVRLGFIETVGWRREVVRNNSANRGDALLIGGHANSKSSSNNYFTDRDDAYGYGYGYGDSTPSPSSSDDVGNDDEEDGDSAGAGGGAAATLALLDDGNEDNDSDGGYPDVAPLLSASFIPSAMAAAVVAAAAASLPRSKLAHPADSTNHDTTSAATHAATHGKPEEQRLPRPFPLRSPSTPSSSSSSSASPAASFATCSPESMRTVPSFMNNSSGSPLTTTYGSGIGIEDGASFFSSWRDRRVYAATAAENQEPASPSSAAVAAVPTPPAAAAPAAATGLQQPPPPPQQHHQQQQSPAPALLVQRHVLLTIVSISVSLYADGEPRRLLLEHSLDARILCGVPDTTPTTMPSSREGAPSGEAAPALAPFPQHPPQLIKCDVTLERLSLRTQLVGASSDTGDTTVLAPTQLSLCTTTRGGQHHALSVGALVLDITRADVATVRSIAADWQAAQGRLSYLTSSTAEKTLLELIDATLAWRAAAAAEAADLTATGASVTAEVQQYERRKAEEEKAQQQREEKEERRRVAAAAAAASADEEGIVVVVVAGEADRHSDTARHTDGGSAERAKSTSRDGAEAGAGIITEVAPAQGNDHGTTTATTSTSTSTATAAITTAATSLLGSLAAFTRGGGSGSRGGAVAVADESCTTVPRPLRPPPAPAPLPTIASACTLSVSTDASEEEEVEMREVVSVGATDQQQQQQQQPCPHTTTTTFAAYIPSVDVTLSDHRYPLLRARIEDVVLRREADATAAMRSVLLKLQRMQLDVYGKGRWDTVVTPSAGLSVTRTQTVSRHSSNDHIAVACEGLQLQCSCLILGKLLYATRQAGDFFAATTAAARQGRSDGSSGSGSDHDDEDEEDDGDGYSRDDLNAAGDQLWMRSESLAVPDSTTGGVTSDNNTKSSGPDTENDDDDGQAEDEEAAAALMQQQLLMLQLQRQVADGSATHRFINDFSITFFLLIGTVTTTTTTTEEGDSEAKGDWFCLPPSASVDVLIPYKRADDLSVYLYPADCVTTTTTATATTSGANDSGINYNYGDDEVDNDGDGGSGTDEDNALDSSGSARAGVIIRRSRWQWPSTVTSRRRRIRSGSGSDTLTLGDDENNNNSDDDCSSSNGGGGGGGSEADNPLSPITSIGRTASPSASTFTKPRLRRWRDFGATTTAAAAAAAAADAATTATAAPSVSASASAGAVAAFGQYQLNARGRRFDVSQTSVRVSDLQYGKAAGMVLQSMLVVLSCRDHEAVATTTNTSSKGKAAAKAAAAASSSGVSSGDAFGVQGDAPDITYVASRWLERQAASAAAAAAVGVQSSLKHSRRQLSSSSLGLGGPLAASSSSSPAPRPPPLPAVVATTDAAAEAGLVVVHIHGKTTLRNECGATLTVHGAQEQQREEGIHYVNNTTSSSASDASTGAARPVTPSDVSGGGGGVTRLPTGTHCPLHGSRSDMVVLRCRHGRRVYAAELNLMSADSGFFLHLTPASPTTAADPPRPFDDACNDNDADDADDLPLVRAESAWGDSRPLSVFIVFTHIAVSLSTVITVYPRVCIVNHVGVPMKIGLWQSDGRAGPRTAADRASLAPWLPFPLLDDGVGAGAVGVGAPAEAPLSKEKAAFYRSLVPLAMHDDLHHKQALPVLQCTYESGLAMAVSLTEPDGATISSTDIVEIITGRLRDSVDHHPRLLRLYDPRPGGRTFYVQVSVLARTVIISAGLWVCNLTEYPILLSDNVVTKRLCAGQGGNTGILPSQGAPFAIGCRLQDFTQIFLKVGLDGGWSASIAMDVGASGVVESSQSALRITRSCNYAIQLPNAQLGRPIVLLITPRWILVNNTRKRLQLHADFPGLATALTLAKKALKEARKEAMEAALLLMGSGISSSSGGGVGRATDVAVVASGDVGHHYGEKEGERHHSHNQQEERPHLSTATTTAEAVVADAVERSVEVSAAAATVAALSTVAVVHLNPGEFHVSCLGTAEGNQLALREDLQGMAPAATTAATVVGGVRSSRRQAAAAAAALLYESQRTEFIAVDSPAQATFNLWAAPRATGKQVAINYGSTLLAYRSRDLDPTGLEAYDPFEADAVVTGRLVVSVQSAEGMLAVVVQGVRATKIMIQNRTRANTVLVRQEGSRRRNLVPARQNRFFLWEDSRREHVIRVHVDGYKGVWFEVDFTHGDCRVSRKGTTSVMEAAAAAAAAAGAGAGAGAGAAVVPTTSSTMKRSGGGTAAAGSAAAAQQQQLPVVWLPFYVRGYSNADKTRVTVLVTEREVPSYAAVEGWRSSTAVSLSLTYFKAWWLIDMAMLDEMAAAAAAARRKRHHHHHRHGSHQGHPLPLPAASTTVGRARQQYNALHAHSPQPIIVDSTKTKNSNNSTMAKFFSIAVEGVSIDLLDTEDNRSFFMAVHQLQMIDEVQGAVFAYRARLLLPHIQQQQQQQQVGEEATALLPCASPSPSPMRGALSSSAAPSSRTTSPQQQQQQQQWMAPTSDAVAAQVLGSHRAAADRFLGRFLPGGRWNDKALALEMANDFEVAYALIKYPDGMSRITELNGSLTAFVIVLDDRWLAMALREGRRMGSLSGATPAARAVSTRQERQQQMLLQVQLQQRQRELEHRQQQHRQQQQRHSTTSPSGSPAASPTTTGARGTAVGAGHQRLRHYSPTQSFPSLGRQESAEFIVSLARNLTTTPVAATTPAGSQPRSAVAESSHHESLLLAGPTPQLDVFPRQTTFATNVVDGLREQQQQLTQVGSIVAAPDLLSTEAAAVAATSGGGGGTATATTAVVGPPSSLSSAISGGKGSKHSRHHHGSGSCVKQQKRQQHNNGDHHLHHNRRGGGGGRRHGKSTGGGGVGVGSFVPQSFFAIEHLRIARVSLYITFHRHRPDPLRPLLGAYTLVLPNHLLQREFYLRPFVLEKQVETAGSLQARLRRWCLQGLREQWAKVTKIGTVLDTLRWWRAPPLPLRGPPTRMTLALIEGRRSELLSGRGVGSGSGGGDGSPRPLSGPRVGGAVAVVDFLSESSLSSQSSDHEEESSAPSGNDDDDDNDINAGGTILAERVWSSKKARERRNA